MDAALDYSGPVNSPIVSAPFLGVLRAPSAVGLLSAKLGIRRALWLTVALAVMLAALIGAVWLWVDGTDTGK